MVIRGPGTNKWRQGGARGPGLQPLGMAAILKQRPHTRPAKTKKSPIPDAMPLSYQRPLGICDSGVRDAAPRGVDVGERPRRFPRYRLHSQVKLPDRLGVSVGSGVYLALEGFPRTLDRAAPPSKVLDTGQSLVAERQCSGHMS